MVHPVVPRLHVVSSGQAAVATAVLALVALAPPSSAASLGAPPCSKPGRFVTQPHFLATSLPRFPDSDYPYDTQLTPANRNVGPIDYGLGRLFHAAVADQSTVYVTANGGCDWTTAYSLPQIADTDGNSGALLANVDKIQGVAVGKLAGSRDLYVDVEGPNLKGGDARLLVSHNNGASFVTHQFTGVVSARPVTSPAEPKVSYLLAKESDTSKNDLWRSDDAGDHWTQMTVPPGVSWGAPPLSGFVVDPQVPRRLWAYTHNESSTAPVVGAVFRSDNGGKTWQQAGHVGYHISMFSLWYRGSVPVIAATSNNGQATGVDPTTGTSKRLPYFAFDLSENGGKTWRQVKVPLQAPASVDYQGSVLALVQPATTRAAVSVVLNFSPDTRTGVLRALTLTGNSWRKTAELNWPDPGSNAAATVPVVSRSVGGWWLDFANLSANWLFRYSPES